MAQPTTPQELVDELKEQLAKRRGRALNLEQQARCERAAAEAAEVAMWKAQDLLDAMTKPCGPSKP